MQHYRTLEDVHLSACWLTIGSFDGVHLGHQIVLKEMIAGAHAAGLPAVVLTFHPHPSAVLRGYNHPFYLTHPDERARLLGDLGVDVVITHPFNRQIAAIEAEDFMRRLHRHLHVQHLWVGYDFAMGKDRRGDYALLSQLGRELGYTAHQTPPLEIGDDVVSSSRIRFLLGAGKVAAAATLLGRPFCIQGTVVHGDQRGAGLGFPTANLDIWPQQAIPAAGVYVCQAEVDGETWGAVTNIGVRPTFEKEPVPPRVETHLLGFSGNIYDKTLRLTFLQRLRGERKFPNVQALSAQIREDVKQATIILTEGKFPPQDEQNTILPGR